MIVEILIQKQALVTVKPLCPRPKIRGIVMTHVTIEMEEHKAQEAWADLGIFDWGGPNFGLERTVVQKWSMFA